MLFPVKGFRDIQSYNRRFSHNQEVQQTSCASHMRGHPLSELYGMDTGGRREVYRIQGALKYRWIKNTFEMEEGTAIGQ